MKIRNQRLTVLLCLLAIASAAAITYYSFFYWRIYRTSVAISPDGMYRAKIVERRNGYAAEHYFTMSLRPKDAINPDPADDSVWIPLRSELNTDADAINRYYILKWYLDPLGRTYALAILTQGKGYPVGHALRQWVIPRQDVVAELQLLPPGK